MYILLFLINVSLDNDYMQLSQNVIFILKSYAIFLQGCLGVAFDVFYILLTYRITKDKSLTSIDVLDSYPLLNINFLPKH